VRLLLDIGNTRVKWAIADGPVLRGGGNFAHGGDPAATIGDADLPRGQSVWVCHVTGPQHEPRIAQALEKTFGMAPQFARTAAESHGLTVAYADAARLGVDRWLAMLAAWTGTRSAGCVVSAGTALTFDAVDGAGRHLGGVIAPGLASMQAAVLGTTRFRLDEVSESYDDGLGHDTESCVRQGALHAAAGLIDRLGARHAGTRMITGGDAEVLLPLLSSKWELRPQLVLEGLAILANA
jgi:type III pantothenate kinase